MYSSRNLIRQVRWLTQALIFSVALNIGLGATVVYFMGQRNIKDPDTCRVEKETTIIVDSKSMFEVLKVFRNLSFHELVDFLVDDQLVEDGYAKRDLALACLTEYHFFNLEKALGDQQFQSRRIAFEEPDIPFAGGINVFPGLDQQQYNSIINYVETERWPLTSNGLFLLLNRKKELGQYDASLAEAFYLTDEFLNVEKLFVRSDVRISKEDLLELVMEGEIGLIKDLNIDRDFLEGSRRRLLMGYINEGSKVAANLILKTDRAFAIRKLSDEKMLFVLEVLEEYSPEAEQFVLDVLNSPREDEVLQLAGRRLYEYRGKETRTSSSVKQERVKLYVVEEGDTLWGIARDYDLSIGDIRRINNLGSDVLRPGVELILP